MNMRLICENDELKKQLAEAQADNAALTKVLKDWQQFGWLKPRDENFIRINMANTKRALSNGSGAALLQELEQLRMVRDAAEELLAVSCNGYGCSISEPRTIEKCERWCNTREKYLLKQALSQAKEVNSDAKL